MDSATLELPAQASIDPASDSSKPAHSPFICSSNAQELGRKSGEARRIKRKLYIEQLELAKSIIEQGGQIAPLQTDDLASNVGELPKIDVVPSIALQASQAHLCEIPPLCGLPHQERRVVELNDQIDGINVLMDKATKGQLVVGFDTVEDVTELIYAAPKDIQALSKAKRDAMEMLFRIFAVAREPIAKTEKPKARPMQGREPT